MRYAKLTIHKQQLIIPIPDTASHDAAQEAIKNSLWDVLIRIDKEGKLFTVEVEDTMSISH